VLLGCSQSPSIAPATPNNPIPYISLLFLWFGKDGSNQHKIWRLEVDLSLFEKRGGKSHFGTILLSTDSGTWRPCMVSRSLLPISMDNAGPLGASVADSFKDHATC